ARGMAMAAIRFSASSARSRNSGTFRGRGVRWDTSITPMRQVWAGGNAQRRRDLAEGPMSVDGEVLGFIVPQPSGGECDELHTAFPKTLLRCEQTGFSCRGAVIPLKEEAVDGFSAIPLFGHLGSDPCLRPQMPSLPGGGAIS